LTAGTASHVHISVQSPNSSTPSSHPDIPTLPSDLASFISGVLAHLPTVCAFTLPLDASYARVVDGAWSGGAWVCWGRENKEAPLRLCGSEKGSGFNVELKAFDGVANPYFGLAAVLAAGVTGLSSGRKLEMRDCRLVASALTEEKRREMHIETRMPTQSIVFEPGLDERMEFINSWLPMGAWKLYKDVRKVCQPVSLVGRDYSSS
jgi:glutamine synthetase